MPFIMAMFDVATCACFTEFAAVCVYYVSYKYITNTSVLLGQVSSNGPPWHFSATLFHFFAGKSIKTLFLEKDCRFFRNKSFWQA